MDRVPRVWAAFDPGDIKWDIDAEPFVRDKGHIEDGAFETKPHPPKCWRGKQCSHVQMIMSVKCRKSVFVRNQHVPATY